MNYWAPLHDKAEESEEPEQISLIEARQSIANTKRNKWTRRIERRQAMKLIIDSGTTSNFIPEEMDLPKKGKSNKKRCTYQTTPNYGQRTALNSRSNS
jgi:hypothetical protein